MSDEANSEHDPRDADPGLDALVRAAERYEAGDWYDAARLVEQSRPGLADPEALAEADDLQTKLCIDTVPLLFGLGCLVFLIVAALLSAG